MHTPRGCKADDNGATNPLVSTGRYALLLAMAVPLLWAGCSPSAGEVTDNLAEIRESGQMIVLTRNAPTTYYEDRDGEIVGFEHDMVKAFAEHLGVQVEFRVKASVSDTLESLRRGEGHFAAAGLTRTGFREREFSFGPSYKNVQQELICHSEVRVRSVAELPSVNLLVVADSSYVESLEELAETTEGLQWETTRELSTDQILQKVWEREVDCTIADSDIFMLHRRFFPELRQMFSVSDVQELAWAMPANQEPLVDAMTQWFDAFQSSGRFEILVDHYFGYFGDFDYYDTRVFLRRIEERLPQYRDMFTAAAEKYGFSWTLLAALAYQESHWDPQARSRTGVRGMMMLTRNTAQSVDVTDRLDPEQSIMGGAQYLRRMVERVPSFIPEPDRLWMALASYNVGYFHLRDARSLTVLLEKNPNRWSDVRTVLPLLSQRRYFQNLRHGYARGLEPVIYVQRIRNYHDLLLQYEGQRILPEREPVIEAELRALNPSEE